MSGINRRPYNYNFVSANSSLSITGDKPIQTVWIWKGSAFYECGSLLPNNAAEPGLYHANLSTVEVIACLIDMLTQIQPCSM